MKCKPMISSTLLLALLLAVSSTVVASTTWYVNGKGGSDSNNCTSPTSACKTIGHAISLASSGDTIMVAAAIYRENPITIGISLNVLGAGASTTIVDGGGVHGVVAISPTGTATVVLSGLTIRNGSASDGGGIYNYNGKVTISNSTVSGNVAYGGCNSRPPMCFGGIGGGIYNSGGTLTINNSTVSGNMAKARVCPICYGGSNGGGIYNSGGTLIINNSTVTGNFATAARPPYPKGGGISSFGTLTISNSTISGNRASLGGGIFGSATLQDSIVASNLGSGNCDGTMTSKGYNLSSDNTCNFSGPGDRNNTNPMLGTLGYYGGPTQTIPLLSGSPAIDAGNPSGCTDSSGHPLKTDQRGYPRPNTEDIADKKGCDMGAFEKQSD
jgi:hypothetical protein